MQDGYRILGSGKSGKMAKIYQHHKFPPCLGYPKHGGKDKENLTHFFRHYPYCSKKYNKEKYSPYKEVEKQTRSRLFTETRPTERKITYY